MKVEFRRRPPRLTWIYADSLEQSLDAATWLEMTQALRDLGWEVTLIAVGPSGTRSVRGVEIECLPKPDVYLVRQMAYHQAVLRKILSDWKQSDVILFHQMSAPWILPLRLLRSARKEATPLLVMDTRTVPMMVVTHRDRLRATYDNMMNRMANGMADGQTVITQRMAESVGIPPSQLLGIWPSGVNLDQFATARDLRTWPTSGEPLRLIYVGALFAERNLLGLCNALVKANRDGRSFEFSIIGDGPQRQALVDYAASNGAGCIKVSAPVAHNEVPGQLASAHIGVLPFPDEEKFRVSSPIKLFEYLAAGMPILATRISCHTDVVGEGNYAFWAEDSSLEALYAALEMAWAQRDSLPEMGRMAAEVAVHWTWEANARRLSDALLQKLAAIEAAADREGGYIASEQSPVGTEYSIDQ